MLAGIATGEMLARVLSDEALTSRLIDDVLARVVAAPPSTVAPRPKLNLASAIPAAHCVFGIAAFLHATLAAAAAG